MTYKIKKSQKKKEECFVVTNMNIAVDKKNRYGGFYIKEKK